MALSQSLIYSNVPQAENLNIPTLPQIGGVNKLSNHNSSSTIGPTLPLSSGTNNINNNDRQQASLSLNERGIFYHLSLKQWAAKLSQIPIYGNKLPFLGHHNQLIEGDLCFSNSSASGNMDPKNYEHQVIMAELGKLNEVLATGYYEIKQEFDRPGIGLSDRNSPNSLSHINNIDYRDLLEKLYNIIDGTNVKKKKNEISKLKINDIINRYEEIFSDDIPSSNKSMNESDDDEDDEDEFLYIENSNTQLKSTVSLQKKYRTSLIYPTNHSIYKRFFQIFPEKNRYKNCMGIYVEYYNNEEDLKTESNFNKFEQSLRKNEREQIDEYFNYFEKNQYDKKIESHKLRIKSIFTFILTELLATSEKYIKFCTLAGVINFWHFYGIVNNTGAGKVGNQELQMNPSINGQSHIVNFVVERNATVINRWGQDLPPGTKLWIIVKKSHSNGPYQFYPWYDRNKGFNGSCGKPTEEDLSFIDEDGITPCLGAAIFIGTVRRYYTDNYPDETRRIANGITDFMMPIPYGRALEEKTNISSVGKIDIVIS